MEHCLTKKNIHMSNLRFDDKMNRCILLSDIYYKRTHIYYRKIHKCFKNNLIYWCSKQMKNAKAQN